MELKVAVEEYVYRKRLMGRRYENNSKELHAFAKMYPMELEDIRTAHVSGFLNRSRLVRQTWIGRYSRLRSFFKYWMAKHRITQLPMPQPRRLTKRIFSPFIYSRSHIRKILNKAEAHDRKLSCVRAETFRVLIIFLYGTGVGLGEALALKIKDLNLTNSATVTLSARPGPPRTIPIGRDLRSLLRKHVQSTKRPDDYLFDTKDGQRINTHRINVVFRRVRRSAGIKRTDGSAFQPMLRDLRHTFAVHRIIDWYQKGLDIETMLPKLAAYMGLWSLGLVNRYVSFAPAHFQQQVSKLSNDLIRPTVALTHHVGTWMRIKG